MTDDYPQNNDPVSNSAARVPVVLRTAADKPVVTYIILGITLLMFGLQYLSQSLSTNNYDWPYILGSKVNDLILAGQVWRLITLVLLHASLLHIGFNMYALFVIGPQLERFYGHGRFLILYLVAGFTGNVLSFVLSPKVSLGASTAVFGLIAAEAVFIFRNRKLFGDRAKGMLINLGVVILVNLLLGLQPGIDNWGHLGGLAGGLLFAWNAGPLFKMSVSTDAINYQLLDSHGRKEVIWGAMLSAGLFLAVAIGRFLAR